MHNNEYSYVVQLLKLDGTVGDVLHKSRGSINLGTNS